METALFNTCPSENLEKIPEELIALGKVSFPQAHIDKDMMVLLACGIQKIKGDMFAHLPFCLTAEAEALGAIIQLGNEQYGPRVKEGVAQNISRLLDLDFDIPIKSGRLGTVLSAIETISSTGQAVIFNVNGLFTLLASLVDPGVLYKALRCDEKNSMLLLDKTKYFILRVIEAGIQSGAAVISYADPVGDITLMGKKMFEQYAAPVNRTLISQALLFPGLSLFHLCGRLTSSLSKADALELIPLEAHGVSTYGEGLLQIIKSNSVRFVGNSCIKSTHLVVPSVTVYQVRFIRPSV